MERITMSVCPVCYRAIPAVVSVEGTEVWMTKQCKRHGVFRSMVERDRMWYDHCMSLGHTGMYSALFTHITRQCNLKCKYCYFPKGNEHRSVDDVLREAWSVKNLGSFILTGGEPTLHPQLKDIVYGIHKWGKPWVLTNGTRMVDEDGYLDDLLDAGLRDQDGVVRVGVSIHEESGGADLRLLEVLENKGLKAGTVLVTIDGMDALENAVHLYKEYHSSIASMRIRAACNLWDEENMKGKIFVSDMINVLSTMGSMIPAEGEGHKVSYAPVHFDFGGCQMNLKLVSWYDAGNVDLWDVDCPPLTTADDGKMYNFAVAAIRNEGMRKTSGIRVRRGVLADVPELAPLWVKLTQEDMGDKAFPDPLLWIAQTVGLMHNQDYYLFVTEDRGKIVGFMDGFVAMDPSTSQKVMTGRHIYMEKDYRNSGNTEKMHREGVKLARSVGVDVFKRKVWATDRSLNSKKASEVILQVRI